MSGSPVRISTVRQINYSEGMPNDLIPIIGYQENLGSPFKKWLALYAGELNVETLVAQDTIATIGGRILVGPATIFVSDLDTNLILNPSFEIAGSGSADVFANWNEYFFTGSNIQRLPLGDGTYYCGLTAIGGSTTQISTVPNISVIPQQNYIISGSVKGSGSSWGGWGVFNSANGSFLFLQNTGVSGSSWTSINQNFYTPVSCSGITVLLLSGSIVGQTVGFDNLLLNQSGSNPNIITVKHNEMSGSDIVYAEARSHVEFMQVISGPTGSGPYQYTITRNLDGSGSNIWYAGDALFNTGIVNEGFIDLYSAHGIKSASQLGPSIAGNVRNSLIYNDWGTKWAVGNLNGLYDYSSTAWGAAFGGYGSGSANITIDNVNGLRLRNYNQTVIQLDNSGSALISGKLSMPGASGAIAIGAIPPSGSSAGTGIWIDRSGLYGVNSNVPQAYIGSDGVFYAGHGNVRADANGIQINDVSTAVRFLQWNYDSGSSLRTVGYVFGDYNGVGTNADIWLSSIRIGGDPWAVTGVILQAYDYEHSKDARLNLFASGSGTSLDATSFDYINIPNGNVGIGLSNATQKLVVNGSAIVYGDLYTVSWTDYGASSTVTGWSSTTTQEIHYKKVGKLVFCTFLIIGTSGSTSTSFTLPYSHVVGQHTQISVPGKDNGSLLTTAIMENPGAGGNVFYFYKDVNGTAWTASGTKQIGGQFFYESV